MERQRDDKSEPKVHSAGIHKKPYVTPELIVHGSVEKITERKQGSGNYDGGNMSSPYQYSR